MNGGEALQPLTVDELSDLLETPVKALTAAMVDYEAFRTMRGIREQGGDLALAWSEIRTCSRIARPCTAWP